MVPKFRCKMAVTIHPPASTIILFQFFNLGFGIAEAEFLFSGNILFSTYNCSPSSSFTKYELRHLKSYHELINQVYNPDRKKCSLHLIYVWLNL